MTRRLTALGVALGLWSLTGTAQTPLPPGTVALTAQYSAPCTAATCATFALLSTPVVTMNVSGTFSGTITWEGSSDGGNTYFTVSLVNLSTGTSATTTTSTGQYSLPNSGLTHIQARMTTWASGGANVSAIRGFVGAKMIPFSSSNPLSPANGGTGISSYAIGDLIYASASTTLSKLADVAAGSYLRSGGVATAPVWSTATLPNTATTGDLLYANAANAYANLADIATGAVLISGGVGVAPSWSATPSVTSVQLGGNTTLSAAVASGKMLVAGTTPMLQLGGTTSSFPAAKANGTTFEIKLADDSGFAGIKASTGNFTSTIQSVNSISTAGAFGVPINVAVYETTGNTAAVTNAINYTPASTSSTYEIVGVVNVTAWATPATFTVAVTYKDASGNARTDTALVVRGTGATAAAVTAVDRWYFHFPAIDIDNSGTAITLSTTGTFTGSPVYNLQADLRRTR